MEETAEIVLAGGYVNRVVRVGSTVRRSLAYSAPFVHDLLSHLEDWKGAPRFLGFDEQGREVLEWLDGHVPWSGVNEPPSVWDEQSVRRVVELTKELHDRTAGTPLAGAEQV